MGGGGAGGAAGYAFFLRAGRLVDETAVTPSGHAEAIWIDRIFFERSIDSSHGIAQIAMPKILHVCAREFLALAIAATRIRQQNVITARRQSRDDRARHSK